MLSFRRYLIEYVTLFEFKEWHQYVQQHKDGLFYATNSRELYNQTQSESGHGTIPHITEFLKKRLGISDIPEHHGKWILKKINEGELFFTGGGEITDRNYDYGSQKIFSLLKSFDKIRDKNPKFKLSDIESPKRLYDTVLNNDFEFRDKELGIKKGVDYHVLGENEHWVVTTPKTFEGSCALGTNTSWCTKRERYRFDQYTVPDVGNKKTGPLFVLIPKQPSRQNEKYQFHPPTNQAMDEENNEIREETRPNLTKRPLPEISLDADKTLREQFETTEGESYMKFMDSLVGEKRKDVERFVQLLGNTPRLSNRMIETLLRKTNFNANSYKQETAETWRNAHRYVINHPSFGNDEDQMSRLLEMSDAQSISDDVGEAIAEHPNFGKTKPHHLLSAMKSYSRKIAMAALRNKNFNSLKEEEKVDAMVRSPHAELQLAALDHPNFASGDYKDQHIEYMTISPHTEVVEKFLKHPINSDPSSLQRSIDQIFKYGFGDSIKHILNNPKYNNQVEDHFLRRPLSRNLRNFVGIGHTEDVYRNLLNHPAIKNATHEVDKKIIEDGFLMPLMRHTSSFDEEISKSSSFGPDSFAYMFKYVSPEKRKKLYEHKLFKQLTPDHITDLLDSSRLVPEDYDQLFKHENFGTKFEHFTKVFSKENGREVQFAALRHPNILSFEPRANLGGYYVEHPVLKFASENSGYLDVADEARRIRNTLIRGSIK